MSPRIAKHLDRVFAVAQPGDVLATDEIEHEGADSDKIDWRMGSGDVEVWSATACGGMGESGWTKDGAISLAEARTKIGARLERLGRYFDPIEAEWLARAGGK